jgi:hypothetical protein
MPKQGRCSLPQRLFNIPEDWRLVSFLLVVLFVLSYVVFLAAQQVHSTRWYYTTRIQADGWQMSDTSEGWHNLTLPFFEANSGRMYYFKGYLELSGLSKTDVIVGVQDRLLELYINGQRVPIVEASYNQVEDFVYGQVHHAYTIPSSYFKNGRNLVALTAVGRSYVIVGFSVPKALVSNSWVYLLFLLTPLLLFLILKKESLSCNATAVVVFFVIALVFLKPLYHNFNYLGSRDWDILESRTLIARDTIVKYHQIPLWDPYQTGGVPLLADPQSLLLSPFLPMSLVLDTVTSLKIQVVLWYVIGLFGMFLLGKHLKLNTYATYAMAFALILSSWYSIKIVNGHIYALNAMLLPLAFLFYLKAFDDRRNAAYGGVCLALMIFGGGIYAVVYAALLMVLHALFYSAKLCFDGKHALKPAVAVVLVIIVCAGVSAVKTIPMLELTRQFPRYTDLCDMAGDVYKGFRLDYYVDGFFGMLQRRYNVKTNEWDNFSTYVGPFVVLLAIIGSLTTIRENWPLVAVVIFGVVLVYGSGSGEMVVWALLHKMPVLSSLRYPARLIILALAPLSVLAGIAVSKIEKWKNIVALGFTVAVLYNLLLVCSPAFDEAFVISPRHITPSNMITQVAIEPQLIYVFGETFTAYQQNQGDVDTHLSSLRGLTLVCSGPLTPVKPSGSPDYRGEFYLLGGSGTVTVKSFTPNKITLSVDGAGVDYLIVNQNYDPNWKTPDRAVLNHGGLLAVEVSPTDSGRDIVLYYSPTSFKIGLLVTLASLAVIWHVLRVRHKPRSRKKAV